MPATSPRNPVPGPKQGADARRMAARLERAVDTLARLPRDSGTLPAWVRSAWPEMIRGSRFAVSQTRRESRACPAPEAIDDLDRVARLLWRRPKLRRTGRKRPVCRGKRLDIRYKKGYFLLYDARNTPCITTTPFP